MLAPARVVGVGGYRHPHDGPRQAPTQATVSTGRQAERADRAVSRRCHEVVFFQRHIDDDPAQTEPGRAFLNSCPTKVRATMRAVLAEVAAAPPKRFAGGGYWEAMKGDMVGWFEVRVDGPSRHHYRLFCKLDYDAEGVDKPLLVVIDGRDKPVRTELAARDYRAVRAMGEEYLSRNPRSFV